MSYREPDIDEGDFDEVGAAFESRGTATRAGQARCTLLPARPLVDFAIPGSNANGTELIDPSMTGLPGLGGVMLR